MSNKLVTILFLVGFIAFITVLLLSPAAKMENPTVVTQKRLTALKSAVLNFAETNQALPQELSELKLSEEAMADHAGVPFVYQVEGNRVTIISYGADGKPGGHTFRADKKESFTWPE